MVSQAQGARSDGTVQAAAPGRVNLIGEHTDYNDGLMLPMPIPQQTHVRLTPRADRRVLLSSDGAPPAEYQIKQEHKTGGWIDYVQGITQALVARGWTGSGFEAHVSSEVPIGAGLSSSAALEVAMLRALRQAFSLSLDDMTIARIGQLAEVEFVGAPTGIMDQMASSLGEPGSALFIDMRSDKTRRIALPTTLELVVIASGVTHAHGSGGYRTRREECERACQQLGVSSLRDVSLAQLDAATALEPLLRRRARHVLTENERVLQTIEALEHDDRPALKALFAASHASMRDDYEVSVPEIDLLVALGASQPAIVAARLTGGGFGGSVVMLAERGRGLSAAQEIVARYDQQTGQRACILLPQAATSVV
ncbi:MAG: Galactokinase [Myxococcaceae bacterium]|nr:Galactokinase [Myxococcaceae bacterium]